MEFPSRTTFVVAALLAFPVAADVQDFRPLKPLLPHGPFSACRSRGVEGIGPSRDFIVQVEVDEAGTIESFELPDRSPGWLTDIAACAVERIVFEPEIKDGIPAKTRAQFQLAIAPVTGNPESELGVASVGEFITPARMRPRAGKSLSGCLPVNLRGIQVSRLMMTATVAADGAIIATELPVGSEAWMAKSAECIANQLRFYPATRNGMAIESTTEVPLVLKQYGSGKFEYAKIRADTGMIEAAFQACYPPGKQLTGSVVFEFDVHRDGSVSNAKIMRGSGDAELDGIASCILPRLKFEPAKVDDKPTKTHVTWELPLRPPS